MKLRPQKSDQSIGPPIRSPFLSSDDWHSTHLRPTRNQRGSLRRKVGLRRPIPRQSREVTARLFADRTVPTDPANGPGYDDANLFSSWLNGWHGSLRHHEQPTPFRVSPYAVFTYHQLLPLLACCGSISRTARSTPPCRSSRPAWAAW